MAVNKQQQLAMGPLSGRVHPAGAEAEFPGYDFFQQEDGLLRQQLCLGAGLDMNRRGWQERLEAMFYRAEPQFKPLEQFVIGLPGLERNHYMVLELALMSRHAEQLALWETVLPALRNTTLSYFSSFDHQQVQAQLQDLSLFEQELQTALNQRLDSYGYASSVEAVLITKLVIQ